MCSGGGGGGGIRVDKVVEDAHQGAALTVKWSFDGTVIASGILLSNRNDMIKVARRALLRFGQRAGCCGQCCNKEVGVVLE